MSARIDAFIAESRLSTQKVRDDIYMKDSHGTLPSSCPSCDGFLDFKDKDTLQCRECGKEINLD